MTIERFTMVPQSSNLFDPTEDLFPDVQPAAPSATRLTCVACRLAAMMPADRAGQLCDLCREDLDRTHGLAASRLEFATERFERFVRTASLNDQGRYARIEQERIKAAWEPTLTARLNRSINAAREVDDGLGRILVAEAELWAVSADVMRVYDAIDAARS